MNLDKFFNEDILGQMIININFSNGIVFELVIPDNISTHINDYLSNEPKKGLKCLKKEKNDSYLFWNEEIPNSIDSLINEINKLITFSIEKELKIKILKEKTIELKKMVESFDTNDLKNLEIIIKN